MNTPESEDQRGAGIAKVVKIVRARLDITWNQVLLDFIYQPPFQITKIDSTSTLNRSCTNRFAETKGLLSQIEEFPKKHFNEWSFEETKYARQQLETFVSTKGLNPLVPETWYSISKRFLSGLKVR